MQLAKECKCSFLLTQCMPKGPFNRPADCLWNRRPSSRTFILSLFSFADFSLLYMYMFSCVLSTLKLNEYVYAELFSQWPRVSKVHADMHVVHGNHQVLGLPGLDATVLQEDVSGDCETIRPPPLMWPRDVSYPGDGGWWRWACMQPVIGQ